jgi:hypothetical protein
MKIFYLFALALLTPSSVHAQQDASTSMDSLTHEKFLTIINFNKNQSYVTFGSGIGNQIPILFEAQFSPSYFISINPKKWVIMMNPQVQMRMLDKRSMPIQVPSYHMYLTYFRKMDFWTNSFLGKHLYKDAMWFGSVVHHSNGQDGSFYKNDTTKNINLTGGNFAVNYLQLGVTTYTFAPVGKKYFSIREFTASTELYPASWCDPNLKGNYGFTRLFGSFTIGGPWRQDKRDWMNRWLENSSLELKSGWIFGSYRNFSPLEVSRRLILDITYKYYPPWFDEIAFFLRFYTGQDYYNIYFEKQLTSLTVGITSNTIKLSNAIRVLGTSKKSSRK